MRRGDLVTVALQGDHGKPRPALIVQSDLFGEHPSMTILPVTGELRGLPLFRVPVGPSEANGLRVASEIMVDKAQTVPREKLGPGFGRLDDATMLEVSRALALFLGLG